MSKREWSQDDVETAKRLYDEGFEYRDIASHFGCSRDAVYSILYKHYRNREARNTGPKYFEDTPIGLTPECTRYRKDCKLGSEILQGMVMDLLNRMSPAEVADVLGMKPGAPVPGTERPYISPYAFGLAA